MQRKSWRNFEVERNTRHSFLLGASWSHHPSWPQRRTHVYLGPWVATITTRRKA